MAAPAPNKAAAPTAPVFIGTPAPSLRLEEALGPGATVAVGVATPEVKGTLDALDAPLKAGAPAVAEAIGEAVLFIGLRTLNDDVSKWSPTVQSVYNSLINHVDDAIGNQNIWSYDLCAIDEDRTVLNANREIHTAQSRQVHVVHQHGRIAHSPIDDMVFKHGSQIAIADILKGRTNCLERHVGRGKDCKITHMIDGVDEISRCQRSRK